MSPKLLSQTKSLAILLATLIVGVALGAALTGAVVQKRVASILALGERNGFVEQLLEVLEPVSDTQRQTIVPILDRAGGEIETVLDGARSDFHTIMDELSADLSPHLTPEQIETLQKSRDRIRKRYTARAEGGAGD